MGLDQSERAQGPIYILSGTISSPMIERGRYESIFWNLIIIKIAYALDLMTPSKQNHHNFSLLYFNSHLMTAIWRFVQLMIMSSSNSCFSRVYHDCNVRWQE